MKVLDKKQYENLREEGARLIGRIISYDSIWAPIYFMVSPEQQNLSPEEILDALFLIHPPISGQFDVIRHWAKNEVVTINYEKQ